MQSLIERLRTDFARKTLGELIQEREAAAFEIERLTRELIRCSERVPATRGPRPQQPPLAQYVDKGQADARKLLRLRDVCEMIGLSRSSIYLAMDRRGFPRPLRIGTRAVRWKAIDVASWLRAKEAHPR